MKEYWIVPCNVKQFNVIEHFKTQDTVVWKNSFSINEDDVVYIYVGAPYSEIKYKCKVLSASVSDELLNKNNYARVVKTSNNFYSKKVKYIVMKKLGKYPDGLLTLKELKDHGLGQVQMQARTGRKVQKYLDEVESTIDLQEG